MIKNFAFLLVTILVLASCKKDDSVPSPAAPQVKFVFRFDSTQVRLNNIGESSVIQPGFAAQSPVFNKMSAHYLELTTNAFTALGAGTVLYRAAETSAGGSNAIDFNQSVLTGNNETFLTVPVSNFTPGTYNWVRVSLAYQNYNIRFRAAGLDLAGTIASFIGFNTYIQQHKVKDSTITVSGNRSQGYWAFETSYAGFGSVTSGQAPAGATTVPNPIFATSPIPQGSCVVTGKFASPLVITGNETSDVTVIISLSTNKSFEWQDANSNGIYEPLDGDIVKDMGIRGLIPFVQ
jgi:hypothetical protein